MMEILQLNSSGLNAILLKEPLTASIQAIRVWGVLYITRNVWNKQNKACNSFMKNYKIL